VVKNYVINLKNLLLKVDRNRVSKIEGFQKRNI